jgi:hypothetical protein
VAGTVRWAGLATGVRVPYGEHGDADGVPVVFLHPYADSHRSSSSGGRTGWWPMVRATRHFGGYRWFTVGPRRWPYGLADEVAGGPAGAPESGTPA